MKSPRQARCTPRSTRRIWPQVLEASGVCRMLRITYWPNGYLTKRRCQRFSGLISFFPTCQVRVVRFYQSCSPPPPPPPLPPHTPPPPRSPDPSGHSRTSTASSRSQWAQPDLHRKLQIPVGTAGPQPRLPGRSGHCRTSTATSRSQWALPDLNRDF